MKDIEEQACQTLLIYHNGALGDTLFLYPVLRIFREFHPHSQIVVIGGEPWRLLAFLGWVDSVFSCHSRFVSDWFRENTATCPVELVSLLKPPLKAWIFLHHPPRGLLNWLSPLCIEPPTCIPVYPSSGHATEFYAKMLLGIHYKGPWPHLGPKSPTPKTSSSPPPAKRSAIIHAGSGNPIKNLPLTWVEELCQSLKTYNIEPYLLIGPAESERGFLENLATQEVPLLIPETLKALYEMLGKHRTFVGTDSGPTHLASAMGLYTLAFFGPSDPEKFSIWGPFGAVFWGREDCAPCMRERAPKSCSLHRPCLLRHTPSDAARSLKAFFDRD